ncbi:glutamate racemase 2 [Paenibacillus albidus]|uniref:Glutamate racemase n=1 Tax=Paenibacillus albidus TaxID=2041023 RepID=A0A917D137_9BACL|nr:glutamate racemase [Paenibacillus albidus]GGG05492.1 glutamate racemase 2 [Paenibacillus albidus]
MKIGFFDSGIGGLTVLRQAMKIMPDEDYLFYADDLHLPYGEKSKEEVRQYIFEAARFIASQGVEAIVVACNTATSVAVADLRRRYDFPILGIEPAVKSAVQQNTGERKKVLVLATALTLKEEKFQNLVKRVDPEQVVDSLPLPGLVHYAEQLEFREAVVEPYLREQFSSLDMQQYGTIVLGCTHFPYFKSIVARLAASDADIIDGSLGTARHLKRLLEARGPLGKGSGRITFYRSGQQVEDVATLSSYNKLLELAD